MLATVGAIPSLDSHGIKEVGKDVPTYPVYKVDDVSCLRSAIEASAHPLNKNDTTNTMASTPASFFNLCILFFHIRIF